MAACRHFSTPLFRPRLAFAPKTRLAVEMRAGRARAGCLGETDEIGEDKIDSGLAAREPFKMRSRTRSFLDVQTLIYGSESQWGRRGEREQKVPRNDALRETEK